MNKYSNLFKIINSNELIGFSVFFCIQSKKIKSKLINIDNTNISIRYEELQIDMKEYLYDMKEYKIDMKVNQFGMQIYHTIIKNCITLSQI